ncbi:hypothetical protein AC578_2376 [Pseudocercospora eumusae]|uniref:Uncharacterized protein n=1 Tax=Pseudocercospora eumusae TaxID=321146 RepID=A0A139HXF4_9PEZI|nr:hypothetical protein AC578_2376 [Pseudocercospora eumusae]
MMSWLQQCIIVLVKAITFSPGIIAILIGIDTIRRACGIGYSAQASSQLVAAASLIFAGTVACIISYVFLPDQDNGDAGILSPAVYGPEPFLISSTIVAFPILLTFLTRKHDAEMSSRDLDHYHLQRETEAGRLSGSGETSA